MPFEFYCYVIFVDLCGVHSVFSLCRNLLQKVRSDKNKIEDAGVKVDESREHKECAAHPVDFLGV